ncbi:hypothetical protein RBB79_08915 [Tunturiibacter empetritectus]|uniref:Uncharacterized protein n=1 Tax=Tunturiibacter lichenicola TaxID=2051959 RepID=A0A852VJN3_9BACT|nr:hypothetical protein [Edaphobacter lichenicola]NYF89662.1 hypothetical protein [Edaphobacter lichenicola]
MYGRDHHTFPAVRHSVYRHASFFQRVTSSGIDSSSRTRHTARETVLTGAAAAIGNAIYKATGRRICGCPITGDKIMQTT